MKKFVALLSLAYHICANAQLTGIVRDNYFLPVGNAKVECINENNPQIHYTATTNSQGQYFINSLSVETILGSEILQASPNPFSDKTQIHLELEQSSRVILSIYNLQGSKVKVLVSGALPAGIYSYSWDGTTSSGHRLAPGMYLIILETIQKRWVQKLMLLPPEEITSTGSIHELKSMQEESYQMTISGSDIDTLVLQGVVIPTSRQYDFTVYRKIAVPFSATGDYFGIWDGSAFKPFFIKGINLGVSVPGSLPGELAATRDQYSRWLNSIGAAGFNAIRTYTLHYPRFYEELALYNNQHPDHPLYLFQGIWLQEDTLNGNLYHYTDDFDSGIEEIINCIHGKNTIQERKGRAYGNYRVNVSPWTMGYIIAREMQPYEIRATDALNSSYTSYVGTSLGLPAGSPTEVWLTARLDKLVSYEKQHYKMHRPVSVSSWPTLDPLTHPSESRDTTDEDVASIDLQNIDMFAAPAGYFASFHAYPYYPDFVNRDTAYQKYSDPEGKNPYVGYLTDLKNHYSGRPLLIAEYGVPSSWGNAHSSLSGMHHGHHTEEEQGLMDMRLLNNIRSTRCAGGMLFSWLDEWFKRTWLLDPVKSTPNRMPLWHSIASPEVNFGLIAFDPGKPSYQKYILNGNGSHILEAQAAANAEFFFIKVILNDSFTNYDSLWLGLDTYDESLGESVLPDRTTTSGRAEFAMLVRNDSAKLFVTQAYDLFAIWFRGDEGPGPEQLFHSTASDGAPWNLVRWKNNFGTHAFQKIGELKVTQPGKAVTSLDAVHFGNDTIYIRIPWHLLNFTDPSNLEVMNDVRSTPARETAMSDGIKLTISWKGDKFITGRMLWNPWNQAPGTTERAKASLTIVSQGNQTISDTPPSMKKTRKRK